jgi:hypothetical protein
MSRTLCPNPKQDWASGTQGFNPSCPGDVVAVAHRAEDEDAAADSKKFTPKAAIPGARGRHFAVGTALQPAVRLPRGLRFHCLRELSSHNRRLRCCAAVLVTVISQKLAFRQVFFARLQFCQRLFED